MYFGHTQANLSSRLRKNNSKQLPVIFATGLWRLLGKSEGVDATFHHYEHLLYVLFHPFEHQPGCVKILRLQ